MPFTELFLVRHGMRLNLEDPKWGETALRPNDSPLSENGIRQAQETGEYLRQYPVQHIFSSPFLRTVQTASLIALAMRREFMIEDGLMEFLNPDWSAGRKPDYINETEVRQRFHNYDSVHISVVRPAFPELSEALDVQARVEKTIRLLDERYDGCAVFVGHGASIAQAVVTLLGSLHGITVDMCSITHVKRVNGAWKLVFSGTEHLSVTEAQILYGLKTAPIVAK